MTTQTAEINATIRSLKAGDVLLLQTEGMKKPREVTVKSVGEETATGFYVSTTGPKCVAYGARHIQGGCLRASEIAGALWSSTVMQPMKALLVLQVVARA